jgi:hypothetical protein
LKITDEDGLGGGAFLTVEFNGQEKGQCDYYQIRELGELIDGFGMFAKHWVTPFRKIGSLVLSSRFYCSIGPTGLFRSCAGGRHYTI